jgi:hypothetical protein
MPQYGGDRPHVLGIDDGDCGGGAIAKQMRIDRRAEFRPGVPLDVMRNRAAAQGGAIARDPQGRDRARRLPTAAGQKDRTIYSEVPFEGGHELGGEGAFKRLPVLRLAPGKQQPPGPMPVNEVLAPADRAQVPHPQRAKR